MKFEPGQIVSTPAALRAMEEAGDDPASFLARHFAADWGELDAEDVRENELSLAHGFRLLSAYRLSSGTTIWIIKDRPICNDVPVARGILANHQGQIDPNLPPV